MKKILIFSTLFMALPALATTICADDDVIAIVLDPELNGTSNTYNENAFEWGVNFSYGSVWGIATCIDVASTTTTTVRELKSTDGELTTGGERKGTHCWCQITHPTTSNWVYRTSYPSIDTCGTNCAHGCSNDLAHNYQIRATLFGSIVSND